VNDARYKKLLKELQKLEKAVAKDLLAKCREPGPVHDRMVERHAAAEVGGVADDWFPIAAGRAAVQFLLRTVYVRVLEDLRLLEPHRIRGQRGYQAFRELAPNLGRQAYFRWIFLDLARDFPALFEPGQDEPGMPAEELCETLWELWHKEDGKGGLFYDFTAADGETFDGRFLGDLYQDLDKDVRKRYALLQTPEFVESYILDYTLDPAMQEFDPAELQAKGECFRMLDPTCGSGHFLLGGFKRLFRYWTEKEPELPVLERVQRALDSVWGSDINDYAVAVAHFRLLLAAAEVLREGESLAALSTLASQRLNLIVADSLVPWEGIPGQQDFAHGRASTLLTTFGEESARQVAMSFFGQGFHCVVGNPPYIVPKDIAKKDAYRTFWPDSCYGAYGLSAPFVERFVRLGVRGGFSGQITANSFMKRQFGKPLVEQVLPRLDLVRVVDTSGAYIPGHGTPTLILFIRNRLPSAEVVSAVLGKNGEPGRPERPEEGRVWTGILKATESATYEDDFVSAAALGRELLASHPWSLAGGGAAPLKVAIEEAATLTLKDVVDDIGRTMHTGLDEAFYLQSSVARHLVDSVELLPLVRGEDLRDWSVESPYRVITPYSESLEVQRPPSDGRTWKFLSRFRGLLGSRMDFGKTLQERGLRWFEWSMFFRRRLSARRFLAFPVVATHAHVAICTGQRVHNSKAPILALGASATADDHLDLAALLNSSVLAFWMRQVFHNKGAGAHTTFRMELFEQYFEYDGTKIRRAPLVSRGRVYRVGLAREIDRAAAHWTTSCPGRTIAAEDWQDSKELMERLEAAHFSRLQLKERLVALQDELDWAIYVAYGLAESVEVGELGDIQDLEPGHRPFEISLARRSLGKSMPAYFERHNRPHCTGIPSRYSADTRRRIQQRLDLIESNKFVRLLEQPEYKRRWQPVDWDKESDKACESWLLDRLEDLFIEDTLKEPRPYGLEAIAAAWRSDPRVLAVAEVYTGTANFDLVDLAARLLRDNALPDNPYRIYSDEGLRKYRRWQRPSKLQDQEDVWEAKDDPDKGPLKLTDPDTGEPLDAIPVPPKFKRPDFAKAAYYSIRGKLNVPRERFIQYADLTPPHYGWNGWRDEARADAAAKAFEIAEQHPDQPLTEPPTATDPRRCGPTLGLWDSLDDVRRWGGAEAHEEFRFLAEDVCKQKSCPCDVVTAWQKWQAEGGKPGDPAPEALSVVRIAIAPEELLRAQNLLEAAGSKGLTRAQLAKRLALGDEELDALVTDLLAGGHAAESPNRRRLLPPKRQATLPGLKGS